MRRPLDHAWADTIRSRIADAEFLEQFIDVSNRLYRFAVGKQIEGENVFMSEGQVQAANAFLRAAKDRFAKVIPDLRAVEHSGEVKHTLEDLIGRSIAERRSEHDRGRTN